MKIKIDLSGKTPYNKHPSTGKDACQNLPTGDDCSKFVGTFKKINIPLIRRMYQPTSMIKPVLFPIPDDQKEYWLRFQYRD